jgi:hypothetical protein
LKFKDFEQHAIEMKIVCIAHFQDSFKTELTQLFTEITNFKTIVLDFKSKLDEKVNKEKGIKQPPKPISTPTIPISTISTTPTTIYAGTNDLKFLDFDAQYLLEKDFPTEYAKMRIWIYGDEMIGDLKRIICALFYSYGVADYFPLPIRGRNINDESFWTKKKQYNSKRSFLFWIKSKYNASDLTPKKLNEYLDELSARNILFCLKHDVSVKLKGTFKQVPKAFFFLTPRFIETLEKCNNVICKKIVGGEVQQYKKFLPEFYAKQVPFSKSED